MASNFFDGFMDGLGEKLSKKAKELSGQAETIYEIQKLRNKMSTESRSVDKIMADLGNLLYKQYLGGAELDEEQKALCEQIDQHMLQIDQYKSAIADMQGKKICPSCQAKVDREVSFCPNCGTACPVPVEEPAEEDIVVDIVDEAEVIIPECEDAEAAEEVSTEEAAEEIVEEVSAEECAEEAEECAAEETAEEAEECAAEETAEEAEECAAEKTE